MNHKPCILLLAMCWYSGSDGGIFRSTDGGENWTNLSSGIVNMQFYYCDVESGIFTGGTQDNGTNQWQSGSSVATHSLGADGFAALINYNDTDVRYQSTQDGKFRSTNGGASFTDISVGGINRYWDSDWIMHPIDPDILYVAQRDIWSTNNQGNNWKKLNVGFADTTRNIRSLAQGTSNPDRFYASNDVELRFTANVNVSNPSWSDISAGLPVSAAMISDIAVDPANPFRVWVTFYGFSNGNKVFYSPDGGTTWINESGSLPNVPVNAIKYQSGTADGMYVGTDIGVFFRDDIIGDWIYFSNGLPSTRVFDLDIDGGSVYAATFGRGLWSSSLYSSCPFNLSLTAANDPSIPLSTGMQVYHASNGIVSTRVINGGNGTDVSYNAGNFIDLKLGFWAKRDNLFAAKIEGCPE